MTQEEKARAYDEALNRCKEWASGTCELSVNNSPKDIAEFIFPQLAESKDERIIEEIKFAVMQMPSSRQDTKNRCLAWLEKQKEQKPKQVPKWLYRLEFKDNSCGLWYNGQGEWCFENGIGSLDDSCKTKNLPMDYDERYKQDGRNWFSSCSKKEDLLHWYSKEDAKTLLNKGFVFTRYLATEYHEYDQQTVFIKETALYREEINFIELMKEQKLADDTTFEKWLDDWYQGSKEAGGDVVMSEAEFKNWSRGIRNMYQQKSAEWSDEDKAMIKSILFVLESYVSQSESASSPSLITTYPTYYKEIDWLKSLRPSWKPSEEQMKALHAASSVSSLGEYVQRHLFSLYKDLKKLM